jgi:hypothetical protein
MEATMIIPDFLLQEQGYLTTRFAALHRTGLAHITGDATH